jgi:hypothetical protein
LQKVVVAMGNHLAYRNTYEEALAALAAFRSPSSAGPDPSTGAGQQPAGAAAVPATAGSSSATVDSERRLNEVRQRLRRYRELWGQGRYAEAGRELEQLESLINQR